MRLTLKNQDHLSRKDEIEDMIMVDNYEDTEEEWYKACITTQETIYKEDIIFWDQNILELNPTLIDRVFEIFLLSQKLKNNKEVEELKRCYMQMASWASRFTEWRMIDQDHYIKYFIKHQKAIQNLDSQSSDPCFSQTREFDLKEDLESYNFKFIVTHIAMFCTKNINAEGKFCRGYYNASYTLFFRSFIKGFFDGPSSRKIIRSIEKAMGDFNHDLLGYEYQNPVTASSNLIHKEEGMSKILNLSSFIDQISNSDDDFDEFLINSHMIDTFGSKEGEIDQKELNTIKLKAKSKLLVSYMKILAGIKNNEIIKPKFELISPLCPTSKHVAISIGGLRGDLNNLNVKWEKYLSLNKTLTVYAYRWKTKSLMPSFGDFVPTIESLIDITSIVSKVKLVYNVIKVPMSTREKFMDCYEMGKSYGKLLAHALILQFPFVNQSVSLFGFSLGAAVLYSCLEELHHKKADNIIQNVYFIEAAVDSSDPEKLAKILSVVRGTVYNYYSKGNKILHLFKTVTSCSPIGIQPLLKVKNGTNNEEERAKIDKLRNSLRIVNVDTSSKEVDGTNYKDDFERNWPQLIERIMI
mmetsp:Transcript_17101/g.15064  ORF Transcript_17101/g.15064 Transcript_17101/m.15064 type:complete len:581 (-) Transcript_17101:19-1761(-)